MRESDPGHYPAAETDGTRASGPRCAMANVLAFGHAPAMPSAAFVLPRLFPLHPFTAALAHHCHRRVGDNEIVMRKSWRCRRWHCQRCDTSQGNQRCDHCVHVALQCASRECRFKRERRCYIPLFWFAQSYPLALCAIAARVSDFDTTPAPGSRDGALAADEKGRPRRQEPAHSRQSCRAPVADTCRIRRRSAALRLCHAARHQRGPPPGAADRGAPGLSTRRIDLVHTPDGGDDLVGFGDPVKGLGLLMAAGRVSSRAAGGVGARCG